MFMLKKNLLIAEEVNTNLSPFGIVKEYSNKQS